MKRNWLLIIILVILLGITFPYVFKKQNPQVIINGKIFNVELAQTPAEQQKGLMNRDYLAPNAGMLFVFGRADIWPFWMKNTLIPLDIIWLAPSEVEGMSKIVEMATLQPQNGDNIPQYSPIQKANFVLELNANSGFKIGDEVKIKD